MNKNMIFANVLIAIGGLICLISSFAFLINNENIDKPLNIKESAYVGLNGDFLLFKNIYINGQLISELNINKNDVLNVEESAFSGVFYMTDGCGKYSKNGEYVLQKNSSEDLSCTIVLINDTRITIHGYRKEDLDFLK